MSGLYNLSSDEVQSKFNTSTLTGLAGGQAAQLIKQFGQNKLPEPKGRSVFLIIFDQLNNVLIYLLIFAAIVSFLIGEPKDSIVIIIIIILNSVIGAVQEVRAQEAVKSLKKYSISKVRVKRNGKISEILADMLVPGDVVYLESGMKVPADGRLVETYNLQIDESTLTGESVPLDKISKELSAEEITLAEQFNMAFWGTTVTCGRGTMVVVATGGNTQLGKIAKMVESVEYQQTPLQKKLDNLGKFLAASAVAIVFVVFFTGILRGHDFNMMLLTAICLAVAAVPEGLPAVITIAFSIGAQNMAKHKAIIQKLPAVETLGSVTTICTDKTGTITENKMKVAEVICWDRERIFQAITLCNDATLGGGDPMEAALLSYATKEGVIKDVIEHKFPRIAELAFSSERKLMTTVHKDNSGKIVVYCKGAFDCLYRICTNSEGFITQNNNLASSGMRVIGVAFKILDKMPEITHASLENNLTFLGLVAFADPPRAEVKNAIESCYRAGIRPVMITGDHTLTASTVAREIGLKNYSDVISGIDLDKLSIDELVEKTEKINIFARVSPEHKLKIISALKRKGEIVAMTGDGVNDAPALRQADIGVAMGMTGTDVSKEASDMILMDDNFATLVSAVKQGRIIYDNMRKFIRYMLSTNLGEIFTMFFAVIAGLPLPVLPIHILWINLVTDGAPAIALGFESADANVMERPPRPPKESILARGMGIHIMWVSLLIAAGTICSQLLGLQNGKAQTMAFMTLVFFQLFHVLAIRSERYSSFKKNIFSNMALFLSVVTIFAMQYAITFIPMLQNIFHTTSLSLSESIVCLLISSSVFFFVELEKLIIRRRKLFV